jgi:hypothetical protein
LESIQRRYAACSAPALSLSAGYDSRGILGFLNDGVKAPDISFFSYALDSVPGVDTDAALSKQLADRCGYPHQVLHSYNGDLIAHLKKMPGKVNALRIFAMNWMPGIVWPRPQDIPMCLWEMNVLVELIINSRQRKIS